MAKVLDVLQHTSAKMLKIGIIDVLVIEMTSPSENLSSAPSKILQNEIF